MLLENTMSGLGSRYSYLSRPLSPELQPKVGLKLVGPPTRFGGKARINFQGEKSFSVNLSNAVGDLYEYTSTRT